jgi:N-acetylmuramoyl-L-alanine amidase
MSIQIKQTLVQSSNFKFKCPNKMTPEYITVHNTANDASAENEIRYMIHNTNQTSYHFAVDDKEVIQGVAIDRNAWHAGDRNGPGNLKSIGIEICYSKSGGERYYKAEANAVLFIAQLLKERGWGIDRVKKHKDWSGKHCPHRILDEGRWDSFLAAIQAEMSKKEEVVKVAYTDKVTVPNTAYWQSSILVQEYQKRGFKCYALPSKPQVEQERTDSAPFVVETDFAHANIVLMELKKKGYSLAVWQSI